MNFKGHLNIGLVASVAVGAGWIAVNANLLNRVPQTEEIMLVSGVTVLGSLAPDLDHQSVPSMITSFILSVFCMFSLYHQDPYPALILATGFIFIKSFSHRGWVHSYSLVTVIALLGTAYPGLYLLFPFALGMIVHLKFGDRLAFFRRSNWIKPIKLI